MEPQLELEDPVYYYFSAYKLPLLINFPAVSTLYVISGFCNHASCTAVGVQQSPNVMDFWKRSTRVEDLLRVSSNSLGGVRMVSVAVPKNGRSSNVDTKQGD